MWLLFALLSSVFFGVRGILYQWTSQKPSLDRNLMLFGVYFTGMLISPIAAFLMSHQWSKGNLIGVMMGLFSFIANASMYRGFAVGKASVVAIITSLPPLVVLLGAYLLWGEVLTIYQTLAFIFILGGIILVRYSSELSIDQLKGVHWALLATLFFGLNDLSSKQSTRFEADILPTLFWMFATGSLLFCLFWLLGRARRRTIYMDMKQTPALVASSHSGTERVVHSSISANNHALTGGSDGETKEQKQWSAPRTFLWGMIVGTTNLGGMFLMLQAMVTGITGLVSAVIVTNALIVMLYARFYLKEKFRVPELFGMIIVIAGIISLHLFGSL